MNNNENEETNELSSPFGVKWIEREAIQFTGFKLFSLAMLIEVTHQQKQQAEKKK